jgi:hypothetical protein
VVVSACPRIFPITCTLPPSSRRSSSRLLSESARVRARPCQEDRIQRRNSWHPTCIASQTTNTPVRASPRRTSSIALSYVRFRLLLERDPIGESLDRTSLSGELRALRGQERYASCANFLACFPSGVRLASTLQLTHSRVRSAHVPSPFYLVIRDSLQVYRTYVAAARCNHQRVGVRTRRVSTKRLLAAPTFGGSARAACLRTGTGARKAEHR